MAQQTINLGSVANDGTGDTLRAGGTKINANFTELYAATAASQPLDADLTALAAISGVQGDIIYRNATQWARLGAGSSGQLLQSGGAGANPAWATPSGSGSGGAWTLAATWTFSTNVAAVNFTGLAGATDIQVIVQDITQSVSGAALLQVSTDNGSSYFATSGDYKALANDSGISTNTTGGSFWATVATAARSGVVTIFGANVTGLPRYLLNVGNNSAQQRLFTADTANDIDAVRVIPSGGGNITGGSIYVLKR
jgi:hypothetical protein